MSLLPVWLLVVFLAGLVVGGFINYCALRLPYERSLLWPRPRCLSCFQSVGWLDCVPVVGYAVLGGRCRTCQAAVPLSYPLVELVTGVLFVALYALVAGVLEVPFVGQRWSHHPDVTPGHAFIVFAHHATLLSFLLVASLCDLADMEIPFSLTLFGTFVGLVLATLFPWPFPSDLPGRMGLMPPYPSVYAWPVWYSADGRFALPDWLRPATPLFGLATGLAGAVAGMLILRGVRFLFGLGRGMEGLGVGDADLMMMAGAFVGWQVVVMAFFVAVFPALFFALFQVVARGSQVLPFGPSLALGVVLTVLYWPAIGQQFQPVFFDPWFIGTLGGGGAVALLGIAFLLRVMQWLTSTGGSGAANDAGS